MSGKSKLHIFALSLTLTLLSTAALAQAATAACLRSAHVGYSRLDQ